jgi:hypothetical protein
MNSPASQMEAGRMQPDAERRPVPSEAAPKEITERRSTTIAGDGRRSRGKRKIAFDSVYAPCPGRSA